MNLSHVLSSVTPLPFKLQAKLKAATNYTIAIEGSMPMKEVVFEFYLTPEECSFTHLAEKLKGIELFYKDAPSPKDIALFKAELIELSNSPVEANKYTSKVCGAVGMDVTFTLANVDMKQHPDYFYVEPLLEPLATGADFTIPPSFFISLNPPTEEQAGLLRKNSLYDLKFGCKTIYLAKDSTPEAALVETLLASTNFMHSQLNYALDYTSHEMTDAVEVISNYYKFMEITVRELAEKIKANGDEQICIETPAFTIVVVKTRGNDGK